METGGSLRAPDSVRKLQTVGSPDFRFYSLSDKVWRADVLEAAWQTVRRNGGAAGVDGETVQRIEAQGVERWLGELARDLKEPLEFLGYRIGRNYRRDTGRAYIGTCPSRSSVVSVCRRISELTHRRYGLLDQGTVVRRLNRAMTGWANYFQLGQVSPAYKAVDEHAIRRLRQWLCRKHKVRAGKYVRFPDKRLWNDMGLARLAQRTASFPWAKA